MPHTPYQLVARSILGVALLAGSIACGGDDSQMNKDSPPQVDDPQITCQRADNDRIDGPVVRQVSVRIQDPDRDLQLDKGASVPGTFQGNRVRFSDSDGDGQFVWNVSSDLNRIVCRGKFNIGVQVRDRKGNEVEFRTEVIKNDDSGNSN